MYTRRQFCGVLGGAVLGGAVLAGSEGVCKENNPPLAGDQFFVSKIHMEQWHVELRHKSPSARLDELRKRFAGLRMQSEAVLLVGAEGGPAPFQEELTRRAKEAALRILAPAENPETARSALETIQADSSEFTTLVFPLKETGHRIQIAASSPTQTVCGYLYTRFFHRSGVSVPLAVVLCETSRCLWETYVSPDRPASCHPGPVSWDHIDREYVRLIDRTRVRFV